MKKTTSFGWIESKGYDTFVNEVLEVGGTAFTTENSDLDILRIREEGDRTFMAIRTNDRTIHEYLQKDRGFETTELGS